jgi:hypothetical protein
MALEANGDFNLSKLGGVNAGFRKVSAASLEGQHHDIFVRAVSNVLSTEIAEFTYAQIIDGLPLSSIADDTYDNGGSLTHTHPLYTKHTKLCPGVLETTRQFRAGFDPSIVQFDYRVSGLLTRPKLLWLIWDYSSFFTPIKPPRLARDLSKHA